MGCSNFSPCCSGTLSTRTTPGHGPRGSASRHLRGLTGAPPSRAGRMLDPHSDTSPVPAASARSAQVCRSTYGSRRPRRPAAPHSGRGTRKRGTLHRAIAIPKHMPALAQRLLGIGVRGVVVLADLELSSVLHPPRPASTLRTGAGNCPEHAPRCACHSAAAGAAPGRHASGLSAGAGLARHRAGGGPARACSAITLVTLVAAKNNASPLIYPLGRSYTFCHSL